MEFYVFILIVLFCTALADLVVGVSNDAVNFLNSAIGSRAAPRVVIMIVASLGVFIGTTFSSGIMEVARKGIFNPEYFTMHEVMIIFLAVMLADIILLDLYNTFALPTSTTVSIVFEILGGAFALALFKYSKDGLSLLTYINTPKVLTIISSIGLSIIFAFVFGFLIQFLTRLIFTFEYEKAFKRYGAIYCGISIAAISYFVLVKGAKGSSLISAETAEYIKANILQIVGYTFIVSAVIWQIIISFTKLNALKVIVLIGTFALALAFAANDLVNFIGAPLGALTAFKIGTASGADPMTFTMAALSKKVQADTWILLMAGAVMVVTLWLSRKARSVTKTEVNLGRQGVGFERFESSPLSRGIVRMAIAFTDIFNKITPAFISNRIAKRIDPDKFRVEKGNEDEEAPAFDLLRATVNLMVASALVSFGTSLKLPLSTTFVTFTVAMATSLADKAWGRESAVYRVNGMLTVIGGWFFTAFLAFSACFIFALFIYFVKLPAIIILLGLGFFFYFRSSKIHKEREKDYDRRVKEREADILRLDTATLVKKDMQRLFTSIDENLSKYYDGLINNHRKQLKKARAGALDISQDSEKIVADIFNLLRDVQDDSTLVPQYAQKIAALQILSANIMSLSNKAFNHLDNNHHPLEEEQATELSELRGEISTLFKKASKIIEKGSFKEADIADDLEKIKQASRKFNKNQMKRLKSKKTGPRLSMLYINSLTSAERIAEQVVTLLQLVKASDSKVKAAKKADKKDKSK